MFKKICILIPVLFCVFLGFPTQIFAEDSQTTTVKYTVSAKIRFINDGTEDTIMSVDVGHSISEPSHLKKDGYTFLGWQDEETGQFWNFSNTITRNMTLIAKYQKIGASNGLESNNKQSKKSTNSNGAKTGINNLNNKYIVIGSIATTLFCLIYIMKIKKE